MGASGWEEEEREIKPLFMACSQPFYFLIANWYKERKSQCQKVSARSIRGGWWGGEGSEKEETAVPLPTNTPTLLAPCYL